MARTTKYYAKNLGLKDAEQRELEVESLGEGRYAVTLEGQRVELESLLLPHGAVSMIVEGHSYSIEFEEKKGDEVGVLVRGQLTRFDVADERKMRMRAAVTFKAEGRQTITAPMPGKIVKVFAKVGDEVAEGQGLVVVEAMKMENELKAPKAGKVTEVLVKEGVTVENGANLVVVE
jgi:biotin carboxyl carrier protein